jgi:FMN phosphatase YigB (HAD superfamily)
LLSPESVLDDLEISQFFQVMSFSEEVGFEKPEAAIFLRTLEAMGYVGPRSNVIFVGDSYKEYVGFKSVYILYKAFANSDYMGATQAGLTAYLLRREGLSGEDEEEKRDIPLERVINSLSQILG